LPADYADRWTRKEYPVKKEFIYAVVVLALILVGCDDSRQPSTSGKEKEHKLTERMASSATPAPQPMVLTQTKPDDPIPAYDVVDRNTYDTPIKTQVELHAVVSGTLTELGLKQLLQKLYDEANAMRGFKYHGGKPTHVFIYLYTSREHFKSGMGQWIAMLSKIGENSRVDTKVKTELISQLDAKPEVKHGLPESKRKEIFKATVTAEDRANADVQRMYPPPDPLKPDYSQAKASAQVMKQADALNTLGKKYKAEVAKRYGITEEQLRDISVEGIEKNWPMP
jgi:hypothetical protein